MKKILLSAITIATTFIAHAQHPTTVTNVNSCGVFRNFNNTDEGFSSPSIYSDANDVSFFWNAAAGAEIENSGLTTRTASLISPVYINSAQGSATVGFYYEAPANAEYRVRIISSCENPPVEMLATTANGPVWTPLPSTSGHMCIMLTDEDLVAGGMIRFEFSFRGSQPVNFLFDDLALSVEGGPLPVTFMGIVARKNVNTSTDILWNVGEEVNVSNYVVESSSNARDFAAIGTVAAAGKKNYSLNIPEPITRTTFYRVKSVDLDGKTKYSPVIRVNGKGVNDVNIQLYPVPATSQVTVQHAASLDNASISLIDMQGKMMKRVAVMPGSLQTQVDIQQLTKGLYIVRYDDGTGQVQNVKLVKN